MNYGGITLHFDQLVQAELLNISLVHLKSESTSSSFFSFTSGVYNNLTQQGNTTVLEFFLLSDDFARLVLEPNLATSMFDTFISLGFGAIRSVFGTPSKLIESLQVESFIPDRSPPYVTKYSLSMNTGDMVIEFSEPINPSTFMFEGLAFQSKMNALETHEYVRLLNNSQEISHTNFQRSILVNIGINNLNMLKKVDNLCKNSQNTFLSAWQPFVTDLNHNLVTIESFQRIFGMKVAYFAPDSISPTLISWDLNLNTGQVILYFDEPLLMSLFNYSGVILCNGPSYRNSTVILRVLNPIITSYANTEIPVILLNLDQFNFIKYHSNFGQNFSNTYLILEPYLAVDTSYSENRYLGFDATVDQTLQVSNLTSDSISPDISRVTLNLTSKTLTLSFSEIIDIKSLRIKEFVLQSSAKISSTTELFQFDTLDSLLSSVDTDTVVFGLEGAFTQLKSLNFLGRSLETTYVAYTYRFLKDQQGNYVVEIPSNRARKIDSFVGDFENPSLLSWSVDMGMNTFILSFTEPIDEQSFNFSAVILQSHAVLNSASQFQCLTSTSKVTRSGNDLLIVLSSSDANQVKRHSNLCKDASTCYLYFLPLIGFDFGTTSVTEERISNQILPLVVGMSPILFIRDAIPPRLLEYKVDLNLGKFYLYFSEPVSPRDVDFGGIKLIDENNEFLALSQRTIIDSTIPFAETIEVTLTRQDYFILKKQPPFNFAHKLWLTCRNETFFDSSGNFLNGERSGSHANSKFDPRFVSMISASDYVFDNSGPAIVGLASNGYSSLTIYFNDVVLVNSVVAARLILSSFEAIKTHPLTNALLTTLDPSSFKVDFSLTPIESQLRKNSPLWSNQKNSYIYLLGSALQDTSSNFNKALSPLSAIRKGPAFIYFKLDMKNGILSFESAVPLMVNLGSFLPSSFTLQNFEASQSYVFSNFINLLQDSPYYYDLQMSTTDLDNIRQLGMATSANSLKLILQPSAITDLDSNLLNATETLDCAQLLPDTLPLSLNYYTLDMSKGVLDLFFNKHVVVGTIDMSKLYLTNSRVNPTHVICLGNASISSVSQSLTSSKWIRIDLNAGSYHPSVRDLIHLSKKISLMSNTYLFVENGFAHDTAFPYNPLAEIILDYGIQPASIVSDRTPPKLLSYNIDMKHRLITLTFDEAVDPVSVKSNLYKLLASPSQPNTNTYWISKRTVVSTTSLLAIATSIIVLELSATDVDNIMMLYPDLCTSVTNTYLSFLTGAARDIAISSNSIQKVFDIYAIQVSNYRLDSLGPTVIHYNLSLPSRLISFFFDEMLNCSATDLTKISFQSTNFIGTLTERFTLHPSSSFLLNCRTNPITRSICIQIGQEDLLSLKTFSHLLKTAEATNLFLQKGAFLDLVGNENLPLMDGHTLPVSSFTGDQISPRLLSFLVTVQSNLILHFSEPMKVSSLDLSQISFHTGRSSMTSYTLTQASRLVSVDSTLREFVIYLHTDLNVMYRSKYIFQYQNASYLSVTSKCISDTSGNPIEEILPTYAMNMGPSVTGWDLNINLGVMILYFSEQVFPAFSPAGLKLQNDMTSPTSIITLTTSTAFTPIDDGFGAPNSSFRVVLGNNDLTLLKTWDFLDTTSLYLFVSSELTHSVLSNTFYPLTSTETLFPILVSEFIPDTAGPQIISTQLDLNLGTFSISFDEPVRGSSFNASKITIGASSRGISVRLTQMGDEINSNTSTITVYLTISDLNALKSISSQSMLDEVVFEPFFIVDLFGNFPFSDQNLVLSITSLLPDVIPPVLTHCLLDLSSSIFNIFFNEIVDLHSFNPSSIILSSNATISSDNMTLSNYSIIESDPGSRESNLSLNLALLREDSFRLQSHPRIGKSSTSTYIFFPTVSDVAGNSNSQPQSINCSVIPDTQSPVLESFDMRELSGIIEINLYFSEVVNLQTFNCSEFLLLSAPTFSAESFFPTNCTMIGTLSSFSRHITYTFADPSFSTIGDLEQNTYICLIDSSLTDVSGNLVLPITRTNAIRVGPQVVSYFLDVNEGSLTLIFTKDINLSFPLNSTAIGFYSQATGMSMSFSNSNSLTPSPSSDNLEFVVKLWISAHDLIRLKNITVLKKSEIFLLLNDNCFFDSRGISSPSIAKSKQMIPIRLIGDVSPPTLSNITLDLADSTISIIVDEPLEISHFQWHLFILQSAAGTLSSSLRYYRLTGGHVSQILNETFVSIKLRLAVTDMAALKLDNVLATNLSTSFISLGFGGLRDMSGNTLQILPENARQFTTYIPDTTSPVLLSFSLDMNNDVLSLYFSEPIDSKSVRPNDIVLQNRFFRGDFVRLSNTSSVVQHDGMGIEIHLSDKDVVRIKATDNLARKASSTFLRADSTLATDLSGNPLVAVLDGFAIPVSSFIEDSTPPVVTDISLDVSSSLLTLSFSEVVIAQSFDTSVISLQDNALPNRLYMLTSSSYVDASSSYPSTVRIIISNSDMNGVKLLYPLASSIETSFLSFDGSLCTDVYGNKVVSVPVTAALQVSSYRSDVIPPRLISYTLDMNDNEILLQFDEVIPSDSVHLGEGIIQQTETKRYGNFVNLSTCDANIDGALVIVRFDSYTINQMKWSGIGATWGQSFFSWGSNFVRDSFQNLIDPVWDGSVLGMLVLISHIIFR